MTPVATANVHDVVSTSLCTWITESLEQFGVDSRVFLRVIQSVLEQDVQSLRGEERLNDLWSYRLESIGSKRKPMSKEDLLRRVLLENMRPCFKEDESFIAEEFVDELLSRWNEEMKIKAETCRDMRERDRYSPDDTDRETVEDTRDPVTQYHEAFPALVAPRIVSSSEIDSVTANTQVQNRRSSSIQLKWRKNVADRLSNCQFKGARGCKNVPGRFVDRCLGAGQTIGKHPRRGWADRSAAYGVARGVIQNDTSGQFSLGNYGMQNASYQGSVFDRFVAQIINSNVSENVGSCAVSHGTRHDKSVAPFAPMPTGFLHRTIEKMLSQGVADDSDYEAARIVGIESRRRMPDIAGKQNLPIYMENEFGVLVCINDAYGLYGAKNIESSDGKMNASSHLGLKGGYSVKDDGSVGLLQSQQYVSELPAVCVSRDVALPTVFEQPTTRLQSEFQRMKCINPSYWVRVDSATNEDCVENCSERCDASWSSLHAVATNSEADDTFMNDNPESDALPDYSCYPSVLGNFHQESAPDSWRKVPNCFLNLPADIRNVSLHAKGENLGQVDDSLFTDTCFTCRRTNSGGTSSADAVAVSGFQPAGMSFENCSLSDRFVAGSFGIPQLRRGQSIWSVYQASENECASRSLESIANLVAEIGERDLMNHLATSLSFLFPDVLMQQPLYLPEAEVLACSNIHSFLNVESRYEEVEPCPYDYRLYLYSALSRGDINVDQILNYSDFRRWRLCVLNQMTGTRRITCICGLCSRGSGCLLDSSYSSVKSSDTVVSRVLPGHSAERSELCVTDACRPLKTAFTADKDIADGFDSSVDVYQFILGSSSQGKTNHHSFMRSGEGAPVSDDSPADESFAADWNKIKAIWSDRDRSSAYTVRGSSIFLEELYEENNNKVLESSNLFPWDSHWHCSEVDNKSRHTSPNRETLVAPSENGLIFSRDSFPFELETRSSSPSSVAFSRLLSSEEETSCDSCHVALDGDLYSHWLNDSFCHSCKACLGACCESSVSSGLASSSSECASPSLGSSDALQCMSFLWSIDDAGTLSKDLKIEDASSSCDLHSSEHETGAKACNESIQLDFGIGVVKKTPPCSLGNSPQNVPYGCNSSESIETEDSLDNDTSSLSFLSANYSDGSKLCESDFGSSEPVSGNFSDASAEENLLVESLRSDSELEQLECESDGGYMAMNNEKQPESVCSLNVGNVLFAEHISSFEKHNLFFPGSDTVIKRDGTPVHQNSFTGSGFENFEHLKILWEEQHLEVANRTESGTESSEDGMFSYDVNSRVLEGQNDLTHFEEFMKPESETSADLFNISDRNFENIDSKNLQKLNFVLNEDFDKSVIHESLEETGLEKIKMVKVLWDTNKTDENTNGKKSEFEEKNIDADKLDLEKIWSQPSLESKNLEETASAQHGLYSDIVATSFGLKSCLGQNFQAVSCDTKQGLFQDSSYFSALVGESREAFDDGSDASSLCPEVEQCATELETLLEKLEYDDSNLVASDSLLWDQERKAENRTQNNFFKETVHGKSDCGSGPEINFQNFQGLASIWEKDAPCCNLVRNVGPDLNVALGQKADAAVSSCPNHTGLENLASSEFCFDPVVDGENQNLKALKSIWENPQLTLDAAANSNSFQTDPGVPEMNEEIVGCAIILDDMENFKHLKSIWEAPETTAECAKIPVSLPNRQVETVAEISFGENPPNFELVSGLKTFTEDVVDFEEHDDLENSEELTLIWEKKKARLASLKTNVISSKENCKPSTSNKLITSDDNNQADEDASVKWEKSEAGNLNNLKILREDNGSDTFRQKPLDCENFGVEMCAKNIEQLKSIWDKSELDLESSNSIIECWGEPTSIAQNVTEELPEWDLSQIESSKFMEKSVWCEPKSNSECSENLPFFFDKLEVVDENLTEVMSKPTAIVSYSDEENLKGPNYHWNDVMPDVENADDLMTSWKTVNSEAVTSTKIPCEVILSDFESDLSSVEDVQEEKFLLNAQGNAQSSVSSSCWDKSENKHQCGDLTIPVDNLDVINCCHEQSLDAEKLNKLRLLWEDKSVPKAESLRRVASLWCWEQTGPASESLRKTSSESFWEPLDSNSENLSHVDSELCWELKASSSDSLKHVDDDFGWDNDVLVMGSLDQITSESSCQIAENLPATDPRLHATGSVAVNLGSFQGDRAFDEDFKEMPSSWQKDQCGSESFDQLPRALNFQDAATGWNETETDSPCPPARFDSARQLLVDAEAIALEKSAKEMINRFGRELFCDADQTSCVRGNLQAIDDREIWLCPSSSNFQDLSANLEGLNEVKHLVSQLDEHHLGSRGFKGLLADVELGPRSLASEWQLAEAFGFLRNDDAVVAADCDLWRLIRQNQDNTPKLVPSENTAFRDKIPHRFAYRYSFFDPRDACRDRSVNARTEAIKHIYDPSHSIMRQLEDVFDDGQRLHSEEAFRILPSRVFRPIRGPYSELDSYPSNPRTSVCGGTDLGDLILQVTTPIPDSAEMLGPDSPYQLYFGAESKSFVPRFRVHKELEKSAQTGEATPPMQNSETICNMNVILSTMALLD